MAIIDYLKIKVLFLLLICLFFVGGRYKVVFSGTVVATAYNSLVGQTDDSPWITASGTRCRSGVIASNHLPIGTKVMIEGFGDKVFTVEDRMNRRYNKRIDIWFKDYQQARKFGVRKVKYHVLAKA
ncbi:MAG: 3D domain-containing protein [Candidatus Margulisbacteria bacterium]|nr:3D domain-containing protein [Candidatus Margulisiibacteriota bacterium]